MLALLLGACAEPVDPFLDPTPTAEPALPMGPLLAPAEPGEDFYQPSDVPEANPGRLIRMEDLATPEGIRGWRVLYSSTTVEGANTVVSGLVFAPDSPAEPGGRPVVAWGHGSVGLGDGCAPSRSPDSLINEPVFREMLTQGFVLTATDYQGLGTPGPHPWLVGLSEGRNMLDSVRAAAQIPEAGAGNRFVAFGASQGGGAALFAGELAGSYAGDLELLGVVAAAPAAELDLIALLPAQNLPGIAGFLVMGALGFSAAYPDLPLDAILAADIIAAREEIEGLCQDEIDQRFRGVPVDRVLEAFPGEVEEWAEVIALNTPGNTRTGAPVLVVHGTADRVVPVEISQLLFSRLCNLGVHTQLQVLPDVGHGEIITQSSGFVLGWIAERAAGGPDPENAQHSCG